MKSILKHKETENKTAALLERAVRWDNAFNQESSIPSKKDLKDAIKQADLVRLNFILDNISYEKAVTQLTSSNGEWMKYCFYFLNKRVHEGKAYDKDLFQEVLKKMMRIDADITKATFIGLRISLKIGTEAGYKDIEQSLIDDYERAEKILSSTRNHTPETIGTEEKCTSDEAREQTDIATKNHNSLASSEAVDSNHHSLLPEEPNNSKEQILERDLNKKVDRSTSEVEVIETNNFMIAFLEQLYNWINQLPEWLQNVVLNSAPIQAFITSAQEILAMYNKNNVMDIGLNAQTDNYHESDYQYQEQNLIAKVNYQSIENNHLVDKAMLLESIPNELGCWIFPDKIIDSNAPLGSNSIALDEYAAVNQMFVI